MEKTKTRSAKKVTDKVKKIVGIEPESKLAAQAKAPARRVGQEDLSQRIQDKAYELYSNRGGCHGDDQADWYEAERIVRAEISRN